MKMPSRRKKTMGLNELRQEISKQASSEAARIRREAQAEAEKILSEAREQAKALLAREAEKTKAEVAQKEVGVYAARLTAKKIVADARNAVLDEALKEVKRELEKLTRTSEYPKIFNQLAEEGKRVAGENCVFHVNKRDAALAKKFGNVVPTLDVIGGLVVTSRDGRLRVDNSFEALLEEHANELKQLAFEQFFARKTKPNALKPNALEAKQRLKPEAKPAKPKKKIVLKRKIVEKKQEKA